MPAHPTARAPRFDVAAVNARGSRLISTRSCLPLQLPIAFPSRKPPTTRTPRRYEHLATVQPPSAIPALPAQTQSGLQHHTTNTSQHRQDGALSAFPTEEGCAFTHHHHLHHREHPIEQDNAPSRRSTNRYPSAPCPKAQPIQSIPPLLRQADAGLTTRLAAALPGCRRRARPR